jgi:hypothetical protein
MMSYANRGGVIPLAWVFSALCVLFAAVAAHAQVTDRQPHPPRAEAIDNRYNQGHYYPRRGAVVRTLPPGYRRYFHRGRALYYYDGVWYAPGRRGFVVVRPPIGMYVSALPSYYTTVWLGGVPYHYADDTVYRWEAGTDTYQVVLPPSGADRAAQVPPAGPAEPASDSFFAYPNDGQTSEQQAADRYECHAWSKNQTGFDPTEPGGGVAADQNKTKRSEYDRAVSACLEARRYSVR